MNIALSALIIALLSLIWNVVSALHSWRANMPLIKLRFSHTYLEGIENPGLNVNVINKGGSPIAVTAIFIWDQWSMALRKHRSGRIFQQNDSVLENDPNGRDITGPNLPFTIQGYHSQSWTFGSSWIKNLDAYRGKVLIEVTLSTGKRVGEKVPIS